MAIKRNYLIKVMDAKIVDVKRALEAKSIKLESIYEIYKENMEPAKVSTAPLPAAAPSPKPPTTASTIVAPSSEPGQGNKAAGKLVQAPTASPSTKETDVKSKESIPPSTSSSPPTHDK